MAEILDETERRDIKVALMLPVPPIDVKEDDLKRLHKYIHVTHCRKTDVMSHGLMSQRECPFRNTWMNVLPGRKYTKLAEPHKEC